jgi:PPOX class probable F420-dependent enzyme
MDQQPIEPGALAAAAALALGEQGLAVVATLRADHTIQSSLVNVGMLTHPATGAEVLAFVTYGKVKLANLWARPQTTVTFRSGWQWATVEGTAELIGPDDPADGVDADRLRLLLREVFVAAGGSHDDWDGYDQVMLTQRRTAVLITPTRVYSN